MSEIKRVKIGSIIESQIPEFLSVESPLLVEFLQQYYKSMEHQSGSIDIISNIFKYKNSKKFNKFDLIEKTTLTSNVLTFDETINVTSTNGWPDSYGLLKINNEIITYTSKTLTSFENCIRGFSGIENLQSLSNPEFAVFSSTNSSEHSSGDNVENLSNLFLISFFEKFKYEFLPGFESRDFYENLSIENISYRIKDLYSSKGTDQSYKLLFKILYGSEIEIIKPQEFTLTPSSNSYFITKNILVEKISGGNPVDIKGNFLFQNISGVGTVSASIFNVEYRPVGDKDFYEISLDSTSFSGNFQASGKTRILEDVAVNSNNILVDSTVGFANSGSLLVKPQNSDFITINYTGKNINQFTGVTNITKPLDFGLDVIEEKFAFSYIGVGNTSKVEFRVVNVIDNIDFSKTSNLRVGDTISLSGFGKDLFDEYEFNSWIYNLPTNHNIQTISQVDATKYRVKLFDKIYFYVGETVLLEDISGNKIQVSIIDVEYATSDIIKKYSNTILIQVLNPGSFNILGSKTIKKQIYKANHYNNYFGDLGNIPTGVQNTYIDANDKYFYVTSSGLPNYTIFSTDNKKIITTNVGSSKTDTFNVSNHNYLSGELVYYKPQTSTSGVSTGLYYVTKVDNNKIKLSYSKSDVFSKKYLQVNSGVTDDTLYKSGYENKSIKHQKLLKKFPFNAITKSLFDDLNKRTTFNRELGMLINGVEILSPTLFDENIYYGSVSSIEVTDPGQDYDIIDVPPIEVIDETGTGVKAHLNLSGTVREIKILNAGYGYQEKPKITITGGNGVGCALDCNFVTTRVSAGFKADINVSTANNTIQFLTSIPFDDGEEIVYDSNKNNNIPGIVDNSVYFVGILTDNKIKLFNNRTDALQKINEIDIVGVSSGFHFITTLKNKNTFTKIYVKDPGRGYSNRKIKVPSVLSANNSLAGINTFDSYIYAKNHGFSNGENVVYQFTDTPISGLSSSLYYKVRVIDSNKFRLYDSGIGTTFSDENYLKNKFVKFNSLGVGTHIIGYPPIEVHVESKSAIGSTTIINSELKPIVLGSIDDVYLEEGGIGYGCTNIINYHRRPSVGIASITSQALLKPIIIDGSIVDVQIISKGNGFRRNSEIIVTGKGNYAQLEPIVENGQLSAVNIVFGGVGYDNADTVLTLTNRGRDAKFLANVNEWKINQVLKSKNIINQNDDGILHASKNPELELQFISFYVPKILRYQLSDNFTENNKENTGTLNHSPILGYAYDGNPIYGPYAYDTTTGGAIRRLSPGYVLNVDVTSGKRPPAFEGGFFINDYVYDGSGDLDIHNGRFAITPEYPNGVYAYFATIDVSASNESVPRYPYVVGPYFYNKPVEENFLPLYNQDFNVFGTNLTRNVGPYYTNRANSNYELIDKVLDEYKQEFSVASINSGKIENVSIFSSGDNYKVNDQLDIDITETGGIQSNIVVSELDGREIDSFVITEDLIEDLEFFIRTPDTIVKTSSPHSIKNGQPIIISGISTITSSKFEGVKIAQVYEKESTLSEDIDDVVTTGISTFIKVNDISGFKVNDFIGIGSETMLITNIDFKRSGFIVNRISNTGIHSVGDGDNVVLLSREFRIPTGEIRDYTFENYTTFFDPTTSIGIGSTGSFRTFVGFGTSSFETKFIPPRSIYLPGHKFYTGQPLIYNSGSGFAGTSLYCNNPGIAVSFKLEDNQVVYAVNLGQDYIGISTLGFTSSSGIGTNNNSLEFWDQEKSYGVIGVAHSLTTLNPRITGTLQRTLGVVTTTSSHNLQVGDIIKFNVSTDYNEVVKVVFDSVNRKVLMREVSFSDSDVSLSDSSIDISSYTGNIETGDKVVYYSQYPINGLSHYGIYYVLKTSFNSIKLCQYRSDIQDSNFINFSSIGGADHKLYFINPPISCVRTTKIEFDLSDSSLSNLDLQFYYDVNFIEKINERTGFFVERQGIPGNSGSKVILDLSEQFFPIYYTLITKGSSEQSKQQISTDNDVLSNNKISIINHQLNSNFTVNSVTDDKTFSFFSNKKLTFNEKLILNQNLTNFSYKTTSTTALGPISKLKINFPGRGYSKTPKVRKVNSSLGTNAVVKLISPNIGKIETFTRVKDGFDYPTDPTLSPSLSVPTVVGVKDIRTIDYIGIITGGRRYNSAPKLLVRNDPNGIELSANVSGGSVTSVDVVKNSTSISKPLEIISVFNSNGYDIDTISVAGNLVTLELSNIAGLNPFLPTGFGKTEYVYPFKIGDQIFIENCRLTDSTSGDANYNSSSYDYTFFDVVGINTVNNTVTYNMAGISTGSFGTYSDEFNLGVVINKNDMPIFEMVLKDDVNYLSNEVVTSPRFFGLIMENGWDGKLNQMRLKNVSGDITVGDKIFGETSKITGTVEYFDKFNLFATLGVSRDKTASIDLSSGILNEYSQRISDNFYYQKFSYSIKGNIPYNVWRESVRSIVHPSGFKEFSDLEIFTKPTLNEVNLGIAKSTDMKPKLNSTDSFTFINIDEKISFNTKKNFARVYEEELLPDGSTQNIFFEEGIDLSPFILNKTNKVINIDDISSQFDGTSEQYLRGRFADASDLLKLNREFIQAEVVAFVEYNYPNIGLSTTYSQEKCKRDVGYIVDAVAHDIKYNSNNKSVEAGVYYWDAGVSYVSNETEETLFAYNYVKFISQYVINNQSPPTLYQNIVDQEFNFELIPDPLNPELNRYKDSRNLILANKREILDRSLASVGIGFPDFYFPGDAQTNERSRYYDGYRLIQLNRQEIIDTAWSNTLSIYPGISTTLSKCKRDLGYFIDAVSVDVFTGGNNYSRQFTLQYFNNGIPITNGLVGEEAESIFAFCQARDLMRSAVRNGLTVKDVGITSGPATYGIGATVLNTSLVACTDVQLNIVSLVGIITAVISAGTTVSLPAVNVGSYTTGGNKCYRDLGYIVDSVAQDLAYGTNQHIIYSTKKYFTGAGAALTTGLLGEESESIYAFESAKDYIKKAITNQLYVKDLTITADPITGFNTDPSSCVDVQTNVDTLVGILTVAIGNSSLAGIPTENYGTADCADVRSAIGNYVGIITTIIGLGTDFAPEITYPSLTRGGSVVGLTTFKLKNKGISLFKHEFSGDRININTDTFTIENHNFQSGQELLYTYEGGTPVGIATTSYLTGPTTTLLNVHEFDGTAILENGYAAALTTSITGVSTVLSPVGPSFKQYIQAVGNGTTGTDAEFSVLITYDISTGQPLSTSITLTKGGSGYSVGETVSIAGTFMGGTTPTNDLSFVVSKTGPTVLISEANQSYLSVPSDDLTGATFDISRNNDGEIDYVKVLNGGSGYDSNSIISIAGTYIGGIDSKDNLSFSPLELGSKILPPTVFVFKLNDNQFKLSGLSTSVFLNLTGVGTGTHSLAYKDPNASVVITIDGVIQKPLSRKSLSVSLASSVSSASTTILSISSGISSLNTRDIINIDNELVSIKTIGVSSENQIEVLRGYFGTVATSHTIGVAATVLNGNFNIIGDLLYFDTAPYGKIGPVGLETGSIFGGRAFSRKFDPNIPNDKNIIFDDISLSFTGIAATEFTLKSEDQTTDTIFNNVNSNTEINNNPIVLINNVFQNPTTDYTVDGSGVNVIRFLSGTPSAGRISKVGVSTSYGYVPRIGAAATVVVSSAGTISDVVVTGGGSGYRGIPVVSIASTIGTGASVTAIVSAAGTITGFTIVSAGTGYTTTSLPNAVIGIPTGYSNLSLGYTGGTSGVGQNAKLTVEVGMGSSIISYKFDQPGVGYKVGDKLTPIGIPTTSPFEQFVLTVEEVQTDTFSGFYPGQFIQFDDISQFFNGFRKKFTLSTTLNGIRTVLGLRVPDGTDLNITNNIFIYLNDVLQVPGNSYTFTGSRVVFNEAPKSGSKCVILYYRGSSLDVELVDPPKTIKSGDRITIQENPLDLFDISQFDRVVKKITSSDQLETFNYYSVGIITDPTKIRPLSWDKQVTDTVISGTLYSKSRPSLQSNIRPYATVIKKVLPDDDSIYVDNAYPLFTDVDGLSEDIRDLFIVENRTIEPCLVESVVSTSSSVSSINILDGGVGYANTQSPKVRISESFIIQKDPIFNWSTVNGLSTSYNLKSLKYKDKFISVGSSSVYAESIDGINWQVGTVGFGQSSDFNSIESVGIGTSNLLISVGTSGKIIKAIDYTTTISNWEQIDLEDDVTIPGLGAVNRVSSGYTGTFNQVVYSSVTDTWVAVGAGGSIFVASGVTTDSFVSRFSETLSNLNSVTFGAEYFVAVGNDGVIRTSNNGTIWEFTTSPVNSNLNKVIYADGKFVIVGDTGRILQSINRNTYQIIANDLGTQNITNIYYNYGFYVATVSTGELYYSFNLSNWIYRDTLQPNSINDFVFVDELGPDGRYVAVGSGATAIYSEPVYNRATATSNVTDGIVTSIEIGNPGFGYDINNPPPVIVEIDSYFKETIKSFKVVGDHGILIGIQTYISGTPGIGTTSPKVSFVLKSEQYDNSTLGIGYSSLNIFGITNTQLSKGDYFVITDSNIELGGNLVGISTALGGVSNLPDSIVGIATQYLDGVYLVEHVTTPSLGIVTVTCNFAPMVDDYVILYPRGEFDTGINTSGYYGRYSWAKIYDYQNRVLGNPKTFEVYNNNGMVGLSSSPKVLRTRNIVSQ